MLLKIYIPKIILIIVLKNGFSEIYKIEDVILI